MQTQVNNIAVLHKKSARCSWCMCVFNVMTSLSIMRIHPFLKIQNCTFCKSVWVSVYGVCISTRNRVSLSLCSCLPSVYNKFYVSMKESVVFLFLCVHIYGIFDSSNALFFAAPIIIHPSIHPSTDNNKDRHHARVSVGGRPRRRTNWLGLTGLSLLSQGTRDDRAHLGTYEPRWEYVQLGWIDGCIRWIGLFDGRMGWMDGIDRQ